MRVNCENCNTSFNLDESLVKSTGSKVRCSKCKHIFVAYPPPPVVDETAAEEALAEELTLDEAPPGEAEGEDLDLSDIEKMLETEGEAEPSEMVSDTAVSGGDDGADSLDLSDIEKILDEEGDDELVEEKEDEDEDLVFDLDEDTEAESAEEQMSPTTELDLGDLEKMFESDEEMEPPVEASLELGEDEEASMSFELDAEEDDTPPEPGDELSALSEELTLESGDTDLSAPDEIEEALGLDTTSEEGEEGAFQVADEAGEEETLTLELDMEEDLLLEETPETVEAEAELSDTELEAPEIGGEEVAIEGDIPELGDEVLEIESEDLENLEVDIKDASDVEDFVGSTEITGEDLEIAFDGQEEASELEGAEEILPENLEIETDETEELEYPEDSVPDIPSEDEVAAVDEVDVDTDENLRLDDDFEEVAVEATPGGGVKKLLGVVGILLAIILIVAAFLFLNYKEIIHVPYLDQLPYMSKQGSVVDPGNLKISYDVDDYRFLETKKAGRIFLISGKIKNDYTMSRSHVQMSGNLYSKGKILADTASAYCGNVIADLELEQMTPAAIRTRMSNKAGENNSNVNIKPGEESPFMIVFFDLPESLDEFTVSVASSVEGDG